MTLPASGPRHLAADASPSAGPRRVDLKTLDLLIEYHTPDYLAHEIVDAVVTAPLNQRVLDPARGSGAVIFAAVRKYLAAARHDASKPVAQVRAEREASGKGFSVTIARRELRRWLSEVGGGSAGGGVGASVAGW